MPGNSIEVPEELHDRIYIGIPLLCNADSVDMEVFLEQHWDEEVTAANVKEMTRAFVAWFADVDPDEFVDPRATAAARGWGGVRPGAGRKGTLKPLKLVRLDEDTALQLAEITAYVRSVRGSDISQGKVLAELITARHLEMEAATEAA